VFRPRRGSSNYSRKPTVAGLVGVIVFKNFLTVWELKKWNKKINKGNLFKIPILLHKTHQLKM